MASKSKGQDTPAPSVLAALKLGSGQRMQSESVWNISLGGVFLELKEPPGFGDQMEIDFKLGRTTTIRCEGFVVWSTRAHPERAPHKSGVSVRLTEIGIAEMRQLAEAIGRTLGGT